MEDSANEKEVQQGAQWYVMRAYKSEGRAEMLLAASDIECFIPKHSVVRVYHGIKSKRLVPVIPSLVFVRATREQIVAFKRNHNFLQFVMWSKRSGADPLVVPDGQMEEFIRVTTLAEDATTFYRPEELDIACGTPVRVHGGRFDGVKGLFMQVKGKRNRRLVVAIDGVIAASVEVHPDLVEVLQEI